MGCEMNMSGAKGLGVPGATRGVMISQFMYNVTTVAMILNEEAVRKVNICATGEIIMRKRTWSDDPTESLDVGPKPILLWFAEGW